MHGKLEEIGHESGLKLIFKALERGDSQFEKRLELSGKL